VREGKHGARSTKQAIAIGLSKARRAGVRLKAPRRGTTSGATRRQAARDTRRGRAGSRRPSSTPIPGDASCAVERRPERRIEGSAVTSGQRSGGETPKSRALAGGPAGCLHEGASRHRPASPDWVKSGFHARSGRSRR
jgi:hypothetical protein